MIKEYTGVKHDSQKRETERGERERKLFKSPVLNISGCFAYIRRCTYITNKENSSQKSSGLIRNPDSSWFFASYELNSSLRNEEQVKIFVKSHACLFIRRKKNKEKT